MASNNSKKLYNYGDFRYYYYKCSVYKMCSLNKTFFPKFSVPSMVMNLTTMVVSVTFTAMMVLIVLMAVMVIPLASGIQKKLYKYEDFRFYYSNSTLLLMVTAMVTFMAMIVMTVMVIHFSSEIPRD